MERSLGETISWATKPVSISLKRLNSYVACFLTTVEWNKKIKNRRKFGKITYMWRLNNTLLNNQWVKEEITREIRTYLETNGNENTMHQNLWDASLRGKFIPVNAYIKKVKRASLVMQWLRICLPMQGTRVWPLVQEDPTCRGAAGPVSHNYWACASGACTTQQERPR